MVYVIINALELVYQSIYVAKMMCHGVSLSHILTPHTKLFHTSAPNRHKIYPLLDFQTKGIQLLGLKIFEYVKYSHKFQYLSSSSVIQIFNIFRHLRIWECKIRKSHHMKNINLRYLYETYILSYYVIRMRKRRMVRFLHC